MFSADPKKTLFLHFSWNWQELILAKWSKNLFFEVFTTFLQKWILHFSIFWENWQNHGFLRFLAFPENRKSYVFRPATSPARSRDDPPHRRKQVEVKSCLFQTGLEGTILGTWKYQVIICVGITLGCSTRDVENNNAWCQTNFTSVSTQCNYFGRMPPQKTHHRCTSSCHGWSAGQHTGSSWRPTSTRTSVCECGPVGGKYF